MNEQCFGIVRTIGVAQPDRFSTVRLFRACFGLTCEWQLSVMVRDTVDNDFRARVVVVTDVADIDILTFAPFSPGTMSSQSRACAPATRKTPRESPRVSKA